MVTLVQLRVLDAIGRHGSVTAAARDLHFTQPSLSHHVSRLEAETGAQLLQRVGRGIRLTEAGTLLASRASEIIGRVDAATSELTALVGLTAGRVRLAGFGSVMSSLVPAATRILAEQHPGLELALTDTHPEDALRLLRAGQIEVAIIFRYDEGAPEEDGVRLVHLLDDPLHLLSLDGATTLGEHEGSPWIGGCERCRVHLLELCADAGFTPLLAANTDDSVVMQSMVAAGLGVTTIPGLVLAAHRNPDVRAERLAVSPRRIFAATYGSPPDPPATRVVIAALEAAARAVGQQD
jgi:DNA-binding transcriptional LysR family regulator